MVDRIKMRTCIQISSFLVYCILQVKMVSSACTGSGFPVDWTNVTDATYWFYSSAYRRQFTAGYKITDYNTTTGLAIGASPTCQDDFYNSTTGYYYYRIRYDDRNIYSLDMIPVVLYKCHGYKKYGNVIREYIVAAESNGTAMDCEKVTVSTRSVVLLKSDNTHTDCPFEFTTYNFTFSDSGNPDYCAGKTSEAIIENEAITLKSCYDPSNVTSATPYNGKFSCRGSWQAEENDDITKGDFIVIEMYDDEQWPYCGRYKVDANGTIILSIFLSISMDNKTPVYCASSFDNEFMFDIGNVKFVRMVFTPKYSNTVTLKSSGFPYWWIIVGVSIPVVALLIGCLIKAAKKGKAKVDNHNQDEPTSVR